MSLFASIQTLLGTEHGNGSASATGGAYQTHWAVIYWAQPKLLGRFDTLLHRQLSILFQVIKFPYCVLMMCKTILRSYSVFVDTANG